MQIHYLDGTRLRRSLMAACEYAQQQRAELNRINVFPVPDGDTGTNLALTVRAISDRLGGLDEDSASVVAHEAAQAAVLGARGNCGMMLSHFLLGFATQVEGRDRITTEEFGEALGAGVQKLHEALDRPREGTILTVMRDTAEAAGANRFRDFVPLVHHMVEAARDSLARTPELLPVLKAAGVVDAGAKGFVSLLEGALLFIHGDPIVAPPARDEDAPRTPSASAVAESEYAAEKYRYCTEALVRGDDLPTQGEVKGYLRERGDSLIVIRMDDVLKVHVHTDEPEDVFTYLRGLGTLASHKAEDMKAQHAAVERAADAHVGLARRPVSVVTDSSADLPADVVRAHGIHVTPLLLVEGDRSMRDGVDITAEEFHARLAADAPVPTTSQPAPADFLESFARAAEDGEEVVAVLLGSTLSGTFGSAGAAAGHFHGAPVHLVDSLGASLLTGLLALKAAELGEMGTEPAEIVAEIRRIRKRSGILFTVDTFDRLLASGRVGKGRAFLGSVLNVKPILGVTPDGVVEPVGKALGRERASAALLAAVEREVPRSAPVRFGIVHVAYPEIVEILTPELQRRWGEHVEILCAPATPVIATHIGVGAWGLAWIIE